jgi:hypothetical protein
MTERETSNEDTNPSKDAVEQIERSHCANAYEVKLCPFHTEIGEGLMQALEDAICATLPIRLFGHKPLAG